METRVKGADRISTTKKSKELIEQIDEIKYFGLNDGVTSRSAIFTFAMALGADTVPTTLDNVYSGGLVLESSIEARTKALMYAMFIEKIGDGDLDEITKKDAVYSLAQEYANTGFEILEDYITRKKDSELIWELLEELDGQYSKINVG